MANQGSLMMTEAEAAKMLCLSPRTMQRLRAEGAGPPFVQLTERRIGFRLADLEAWLASRRVSSGVGKATEAA
jgi:predicted DNA-binding transcriptional regulator AlpA